MQNDNAQDQFGEFIENRICDNQLHYCLPFIELKMPSAQRLASSSPRVFFPEWDCVAPLRSALRVWVCPYGVLVISTRLRQSIRRGGTRQRRFDGTSLEPHKLPDCEACARCPYGQQSHHHTCTAPRPSGRHDLPSKSGASVIPAYFAGGRVHV